MNRTAASFLFVTVLTAALAALSFAVEQKGYAFGALQRESAKSLITLELYQNARRDKRDCPLREARGQPAN